jgi:hypothetical protein
MLAKSILKATVVAGTLDILTACTKFSFQTGNDPTGVLKYITSALIGPQAFSGGWEMSLAGLFLHFVVAFLFTCFYFFMYPRMGWMRSNRVVSVILYGVFAASVMKFLVLPLTQLTLKPFDLQGFLVEALILVLCIALPVDYFARKHYQKI